MSTHNLCFEQEYEEYQIFLSENFHFFRGKTFSIYEQACLHNEHRLVFYITETMTWLQIRKGYPDNIFLISP